MTDRVLAIAPLHGSHDVVPQTATVASSMDLLYVLLLILYAACLAASAPRITQRRARNGLGRPGRLRDISDARDHGAHAV
ncbi:MAG: hypothetical protein ACU0GG_08570 [Paracoccaceae bacterium]